jgi:hypothetical protein
VSSCCVHEPTAVLSCQTSHWPLLLNSLACLSCTPDDRQGPAQEARRRKRDATTGDTPATVGGGGTGEKIVNGEQTQHTSLKPLRELTSSGMASTVSPSGFSSVTSSACVRAAPGRTITLYLSTSPRANALSLPALLATHSTNARTVVSPAFLSTVRKEQGNMMHLILAAGEAAMHRLRPTLFSPDATRKNGEAVRPGEVAASCWA